MLLTVYSLLFLIDAFKSERDREEGVFVSYQCAFCTLCKRVKFSWTEVGEASLQSSALWLEVQLECPPYISQQLLFLFRLFRCIIYTGRWLGNILFECCHGRSAPLKFKHLKDSRFVFPFILARVALLTELYKNSTWPVHEWVWCSIKLGILLPPGAVCCFIQLHPVDRRVLWSQWKILLRRSGLLLFKIV